MKRLLAVAALVLASSAAQAQYVIEYGGNTIRIDPDRGTVQIPGVYDNTEQKKAKKTRRDQDGQRKQPSATDKPAAAPAEAAVTPAPAAETPAAPVQAAPAAPSTAAVPASPPPAAVAPAPVQAAAPPAPAPVAATAAPAAPPVAATTTATAPVAPPTPAAAQPPRPAQAPATVATTAAPSAAAVAPRDPNSPVGIWLTEEKEGKIRIEPCGTNLCGYAVDAKTNQNGEQILINMRPSDKTQEKKWSGRIFDPSSGSTYDSTIALKGADNLKVQGCAFGGMFCGGQTWTRVN
ncbi:DUF2147 domain-containing protein [Bradyrhizobium ontarionense]|uniref:DUF2147 domain-containing protein n=1 Tax=Bradyrhizobium ontarionense TaxID=2898149 RepID=A0ABY3RG75_9BRAD|nr:DUF2147 domain-containing protein [Bradyrhizobium sp. A19]UFZ05669.1 DUF2147 domain-containing protein [Bradyrhizobium sp. A19]